MYIIHIYAKYVSEKRTQGGSIHLLLVERKRMVRCLIVINSVIYHTSIESGNYIFNSSIVHFLLNIHILMIQNNIQYMHYWQINPFYLLCSPPSAAMRRRLMDYAAGVVTDVVKGI